MLDSLFRTRLACVLCAVLLLGLWVTGEVGELVERDG
jgi:hypothetical protein